MPSKTDTEVWEKTQASPEFQDLKRRFRNFAFPVTVAFLVWYFLYVGLTAFARDFVSIQIFGNINLAFLLGVGQFATTFLIMWLYERHSVKNLDGPSEALKAKIEKELAK
jgi:uncharacterized membrane protein (DUF485 family)